jgi:thiamine kinase-like enzyme
MKTSPKPSSASADAEEEDARLRLAALPWFNPELVKVARLKRLVGMTNRVYAVEIGGEHYALRIPGTGAAATIDRRAEQVNARLAAKAGVAPEVLYFGDDGVMLTRFIENTVPLRPERLDGRPGAVERAARAFKRLHDSDVTFASAFRAFATIDAYEAALERLGMPPSEAERGTILAAQAIGGALVAHPVTPKPCHCDPTGRNVLDTGEQVWLVDWEYSGMNDPMWDLAYFCIESLLDQAGDRALLTAYFGRSPDSAAAARMAVLKPVCEVMAALWALIQVAEGATGGDFSSYAKANFERAMERMRGADFAEQMEVLRKG